MPTAKYIIGLAVLLLLAACSSTGKKVDESLAEAHLYQQASNLLDKKDYVEAVDFLRALESRYPFGPFSQQGQMDLIFAYYKNNDFEEAGAAAERFLRLHPQHANVAYAYYMRALASYSVDAKPMTRYLPVDASRRDPGRARQSLDEFTEFLYLFPDSRYAEDSRKHVVSLRNRLARHELHAADYYMKRKAYVAAINRGRYVVEHFQGTGVVEQALGVMVEGYLRLGLEAPAKESMAVLSSNFPNSTLLDKKGQFVGYREYDDVDPSILNTLTFGLLGTSHQTPSPVSPP